LKTVFRLIIGYYSGAQTPTASRATTASQRHSRQSACSLVQPQRKPNESRVFGIDNVLDEHHQQTTSWEATKGDCETLANAYWPLL
jgi:hypothetical protein